MVSLQCINNRRQIDKQQPYLGVHDNVIFVRYEVALYCVKKKRTSSSQTFEKCKELENMNSNTKINDIHDFTGYCYFHDKTELGELVGLVASRRRGA